MECGHKLINLVISVLVQMLFGLMRAFSIVFWILFEFYGRFPDHSKTYLDREEETIIIIAKKLRFGRSLL